jgi:hypothetical protein
MICLLDFRELFAQRACEDSAWWGAPSYAVRLNLVRSANKILDRLAKRFRNNPTLIESRRDDRLNELVHREHPLS